MSSVHVQRLQWLLETIDTNGPITLKDISAKWENSSLNDTGSEYARRTFHDHIEAINEAFGITITCNGYHEYSINREKSNPTADWLMDSFSISTMTNEAKNLKNLIIWENVPSGRKWLSIIMQAMKQKQCLRITHQSFKKDTPTTRDMEPYFIQMHNRRWYVFALNKKDKKIFTLSLDRIIEIETLEEKFSLPKNYNPKKYLANGYGVSVFDEIKPEKIQIKANTIAAKYLRSLPLHESQKEIKQNDDYSIFELKVPPVDEFFLDVLHRGEAVEIISPQHIRAKFAGIVQNLAKRYLE